MKQGRLGIWMLRAGMAVLFVAAALAIGSFNSEAAGTTVYGGVDYAAVYDYDYYINRYADLKAAFGNNDGAALRHFVVHGMKERRQAISTFDVNAYYNNYADLRSAFGNNYPAYYTHYINYGKKEGRVATGSYQAPAQTQTQPAQAGTYQEAAERLAVIGRDLRAAYNWSKSLTWTDQYSTPDAGTRAMAHTGFSTGTGGCYVMAATFYEMAKELGYDAHQISGYVPLRIGGMGPHSWVEIVIDGITYLVDPDFAYETGKNGYLIQYGQSGTWRYSTYYRMN